MDHDSTVTDTELGQHDKKVKDEKRRWIRKKTTKNQKEGKQEEAKKNEEIKEQKKLPREIVIEPAQKQQQ